MRKYILVFIPSIFLMPLHALAQVKFQLLESISKQEFLSLPEKVQFLYVAGIMDGMSYTAVGMNVPNMDAWHACVRSKKLNDTTKEVISFLKKNENAHETVTSAVAKVTNVSNCQH